MVAEALLALAFPGTGGVVGVDGHAQGRGVENTVSSLKHSCPQEVPE